MNNNIQCSIESSTTSMELNSAADGIYLVPELEGLAGLPEIRTTSGVNAGYDGGWTSAQNYDARLIAIRGVIASRDVAQVEAQRRKLASLLGQGRKEQLTLHFTTEAGNSYAINVRTISCEMALQRVLNKQDFLIQLRADDPLIYDDGTAGGIEAILRVRQALGGFQINFNLPLEIGGGSETTDVENGQEAVYPIISLYGPLHSPTVVNMTTNQQMQVIADLGYTISWSGLVNASGEYFSITNDLDKEAPMSLARIYGNIEQTTYSGKNKLAPTASFSETHNGITFTGDGAGKYTISGTATAGSNSAQLAVANYTIQSGDYLHIMNGAATTTCSFNLVFTDASSATPTMSPANRIWSLASYVGKTVEKIYLYASSSTVITSPITLTPMIVNSATATDFEPYVGGIPAPNPQFPMPIETVTGQQTIGIVGKNLLSIPTGTHSSSAVTWEITDSTISASGTATATWSELLARQNFAIPLSAGTYIFSIPRALPQRIQLVLYDADNTAHDFNIYEGSTYVEAITTYTVVACRIVYQANSSAVSLSFPNELMMEQSATPTTFSPYQGRIYKINLGGTNLLPSTGTTPTGGTGVSFTKNDDGTYTISGTASSDGYIEIGEIDFNQGQTYTISGLTGWTTSTLQLFTISNTAFPIGHRLASYNGPTTQTALDDETCAVRLYVYQGVTYNNVVVKPQVQLGSQATPYAPYTTYQHELCKIGTYQDRIYKDSGKWYVEKQVGKVVLDGSSDEGWSAIQGGNCFNKVQSDIKQGSSDATISDVIISDYYSPTSYNLNYSGQGGSGITSPQSAPRISIRNSNISTLSGFTSWLSTHPTTVYYALATPTTTEITNEALVEQLEAAVGTLGIGENNVFSITPGGNATPTLTISYATRYTEQRDTIVIDSQARTITLNGVDAYHLKTDESEFPVLAPGTNEMYLTSATVSDSGYAEVKFKQGHLSI